MKILLNAYVLYILVSCFGASGVRAQTATKPTTSQTPPPKTTPTTAVKNTAPPPPPAPAPVVTQKEPENEKKFLENLRLFYTLDYDGPRFTNFDVTQTQGPLDATSSYTTVSHAIQLGYAVSPRVTLGMRFVGNGSFDPQSGFTIGDIQTFVNWGKMVETQDLELQGVLRFTLPTTEASVLAGKIFSVRAQGNWTLKTPLRNWNFSAFTMLTSTFFKNAAGGNTDFAVALVPYITVDLIPNIQWLFEGYFDANHQYQDTSFDFRQGEPDSFDTGPIFTLNSHASLTTTIKFYTTRIAFDNATPYVNLFLAL